MKELNNTELMQVSGAFGWEEVAVGLGALAVGVAIIGTAGLATVPLAVMGAATVGEVVLVGASLTFAGAGGYAVGTGLSQ